MSARTLILSHLVVFGAGVYVGKAIDAGELATYREAHESTWSRLRRKAGTVAIGAAAVGLLMFAVKVAFRSSSPRPQKV